MNTSIIYSIAHALGRYQAFSQATDLIKDGKQQVSLGIDLAVCLINTSLQFNRLNPPFRPWVCALPTLALPIACIAKLYGEEAEDEQKSFPSMFRKDYSTTIKIGEYAERLAQHSDKILFAATLTSSVALALLGFPVEGAIIFASLLLSIAKKLKYVPASVDNCLTYLNAYSSFIEPLVSPLSLLAKTCYLTYLLALNIEKFIGLNPAPTPFKKNNSEDIEKVLKIIDNDNDNKMASFEVNPSYIFAEEVGQIVSQEVLEELNKKTHQQWFSEFKAHIETKQIDLTPAEVKGLSNLEECVNAGTFEGKCPTNLEGFYLQIKMICYHIMNDEANIVESVEENIKTNSYELTKEFARIGLSCVEGWTREISFYSTSKSNDYKWSIHNHLSKWRGALLNEGIRTVGQLKLMDRNKNIILSQPTDKFKIEGGNNNIHLLNVVHKLAWSQLRTYESECARAADPFTIIDILMFRFCNDIKSTIFRWYSKLIATAELSSLNADLILKAMDTPIEQSKCVPNVFNQIYDAVKLEITIAKDNKAESCSKIPHKLMCDWASDLEERHPELDMTDAKWYEISDDGKYHLSQKGVLLLLWDMGIISLTAFHQKYNSNFNIRNPKKK